MEERWSRGEDQIIGLQVGGLWDSRRRFVRDSMMSRELSLGSQEQHAASVSIVPQEEAPPEFQS